jgi:hypothetical protein
MDTIEIKIKKGIKAARAVLKYKNDRAIKLLIADAELALKKPGEQHDKAAFARMLHHFVKDNS